MYFSVWFIYFIFYSFLGYVWETGFCSISHRKFENRGMLFGPWCPIYGCGAVAEMLVLGDVKSPVTVFVLRVVGSAFLEYFTSLGTEKLFGAVWWDYSDMPLNLNGRICLPFSLCFGVRGLLIKYLLHPFVSGAVRLLPASRREALSLMLMAVFAADVAITADSLVGINIKISALRREFDRVMSERFDALLENAEAVREKREDFIARIKENARRHAIEEQTEKLARQLRASQLRPLRIARAFKGRHAELLKNLSRKIRGEK